MATYTKEINRSLRISEDDKGIVVVSQSNDTRMDADLVIMDEAEAIEVYKFLHRKFGGQ